jgi:hypothetical protein
MTDPLKAFEKCRDDNCNIISQKELIKSKKAYTDTYNKKCKSIKDVKKQTKCTVKVLVKSKYHKLLKKKRECALEKCNKEHNAFLKKFKKNMRKLKKKRSKKGRK